LEFSISMELMNLGSLESVLETKKINFNTKSKLDCLFQIAEGMRYLHSQFIIHRDFKTDNVLVSVPKEGSIVFKIGDVGCLAIGGSNTKQTATIGSPFIRAPEVIKGEKQTSKIDVYSFSMVTWQVWNGEIHLPFLSVLGKDAEDVGKLLNAVVSGVRPELRECWPLEVRNLIAACWNQESVNRPSFDSIVKTLEEMKQKM